MMGKAGQKQMAIRTIRRADSVSAARADAATDAAATAAGDPEGGQGGNEIKEAFGRGAGTMSILPMGRIRDGAATACIVWMPRGGIVGQPEVVFANEAADTGDAGDDGI